MLLMLPRSDFLKERAEGDIEVWEQGWLGSRGVKGSGPVDNLADILLVSVTGLRIGLLALTHSPGARKTSLSILRFLITNTIAAA